MTGDTVYAGCDSPATGGSVYMMLLFFFVYLSHRRSSSAQHSKNKNKTMVRSLCSQVSAYYSISSTKIPYLHDVTI